MIFKRFKKVFLSISFVCLFVSILSLLASINMANILILEANIFLLPLLLSDAILIAILATLSSYVFWNSTTKKCLIFAGQIIGISFFVTLLFFMLYSLQIFENLLLIPFGSLLVHFYVCYIHTQLLKRLVKGMNAARSNLLGLFLVFLYLI